MKDLTCNMCHEREAKSLLYFSKFYMHSQKLGLFDPMLICKVCADRFRHSDMLFERTPVIIPFSKIARASFKSIMYLCSDKNKEINMMGYPIWKKKLLRIKKYSEGVLKSPLYWFPMGM